MKDSIRLKWWLEESDQRAGAQAETLPLLSVSISSGVRRREASDTTTRAASEDLSHYKICRAGDLVINRMRAFQGALGITSEDGIVSPDYAVLRVEPRVNKRWLNYFLTSGPSVGTMASLVRGIGGTDAGNVRTPRLNINDLQSMTAPLTSEEKQRAIAEYLDRETARIDILIEEQQRLIEMLRERRSAAAVNAFASMRGDGEGVGNAFEPIPWLPDLRIRRVQMRHVCTIGTGSSDSANAVEEGYPFFVRGDQPLALDHYEFDTEAIITAGDGAMVGRSFHHYRGKFAAHQRVYVLRDFKGIFPRYLFWYFSTFFIRVVGDGGAQATVPSVRRPMIAGMHVPIPALDEQRRVAAFLDEQTTKIDVLIAEAERFIELARERRSALITAAVTGQIDVRQEA